MNAGSWLTGRAAAGGLVAGRDRVHRLVGRGRVRDDRRDRQQPEAPARARSSLLLAGIASHSARASASASKPKTMNREGSALRAIGRLHSLAQGSG